MTVFNKGILPNILLAQKEEYRKLDDDIFKFLDEQGSSLENCLRKGLSFEDNFSSVFVTYTSNAAFDTEDIIPHTLGRVPVGVIVIDRDKAYVEYKTNPHTKTDLYLAWNGSSVTATLIVF